MTWWGSLVRVQSRLPISLFRAPPGFAGSDVDGPGQLPESGPRRGDRPSRTSPPMRQTLSLKLSSTITRIPLRSSRRSPPGRYGNSRLYDGASAGADRALDDGTRGIDARDGTDASAERNVLVRLPPISNRTTRRRQPAGARRPRHRQRRHCRQAGDHRETGRHVRGRDLADRSVPDDYEFSDPTIECGVASGPIPGNFVAVEAAGCRCCAGPDSLARARAAMR